MEWTTFYCHMLTLGLEPLLLETAADYSLPLDVWTVNDEEQIRIYAEMGVRSITTRDFAASVRVKREVTALATALGSAAEEAGDNEQRAVVRVEWGKEWEARRRRGEERRGANR